MYFNWIGPGLKLDKNKSRVDKGWIRSNSGSVGLFHHGLIYMVYLHLVLPALYLSTLDANASTERSHETVVGSCSSHNMQR